MTVDACNRVEKMVSSTQCGEESTLGSDSVYRRRSCAWFNVSSNWVCNSDAQQLIGQLSGISPAVINHQSFLSSDALDRRHFPPGTTLVAAGASLV